MIRGKLAAAKSRSIKDESKQRPAYLRTDDRSSQHNVCHETELHSFLRTQTRIKVERTSRMQPLQASVFVRNAAGLLYLLHHSVVLFAVYHHFMIDSNI